MRITKILLPTAALLICTLAASLAMAKDEAPQGALSDLIKDLAEKKTAEQAVADLVAHAGKGADQRSATVKALNEVAVKGDNLTQRGWAIAALGDIEGQDVDEMLLQIHSDGGQPMLVRTWAAAGRVKMAKSAASLIEKAALVQQFPALGRPIGMRLVDQLNSESGGDVSAEGVLSVTLRVPTLQQALVPTILALGPEKLTKALTSAKDQNVRRQAAAYLGTLAGQGDDTVAQNVINAYKFDADAKNVTWQGGPLFLPGIKWQKKDAQALVGNLIRWHLWCDRQGRKAEQTQIHNNIRSLGLAGAAGYQSPGWQDTGTVPWLKVWGKAMGRGELEAILQEQGVSGNAKYAAALKGL